MSVAVLPLNIKYHDNLSSGKRAGTCGQTDRQMDIATLLDALRDYKNAPKNWATSKTSKCLEKLQKIPSETSVCYRERESYFKHTE